MQLRTPKSRNLIPFLHICVLKAQTKTPRNTLSTKSRNLSTNRVLKRQILPECYLLHKNIIPTFKQFTLLGPVYLKVGEPR